ncbi:hypothetical protein EMCG_08670 [[Emmonsia] crescens]|uniref:Uncharacterized protein n=1 Tax=[Emmonsia] crescens TaxID=73230 RepID=A0A0G2JAC7_9EURO|nr:hypothetical protein EMCG_08670 [Emmonsia crescens UAMH 3008]
MDKITRDSGGVLGATCHTTFYRPRIPVGARRRQIRDLCLGCRLIPVDRHAPRRGKGAPTLVILCVMQAPVRRVRPWAQRSLVFVDAMSRRKSVLTPIMRPGGAVGNPAGSCCRVLNTSVLVPVMRASAGPVRKLSMRDVIAESARRK